jgi:hypothetical protein
VPNGGVALSSGINIIKSYVGKRYWPYLRVRHLSRGGPGGHCRYHADRVPLCTDLKDQPHSSRSVPGARELWLRHVPQGTEHATRQKWVPVSSCAPWHRARHPPGKGSGVAMCPESPCAPPTRKGLQCCHVPRGTEPITWQERALESPHASQLQARPLHRKALASPHYRGNRTTARQGSGIATCPMTLDLPPCAGGLRSHHVPSGSWPSGVPACSQDA